MQNSFKLHCLKPPQEAERLLEQRLPIPAYDHLLKLSHVFNVLDARGAVGVTERQACFATLRALARRITRAYSCHVKRGPTERYGRAAWSLELHAQTVGHALHALACQATG